MREVTMSVLNRQIGSGVEPNMCMSSLLQAPRWVGSNPSIFLVSRRLELKFASLFLSRLKLYFAFYF